jgi:hypothetical protein
LQIGVGRNIIVFAMPKIDGQSILLCSFDGFSQGPVILRKLVGHGPFIDNTVENTLDTNLKLYGVRR